MFETLDLKNMNYLLILKMNCCFSIDKGISIDIIQSIMVTEPEVEDNGWSMPLYKNKLAFIELYLNGANDDDVIEDYYDEIISQSYKEPGIGYNYCEIINLRDIEIIDGKISFDAYIPRSFAESDWSYPTFSYDETLKTWIIRDSFWDTPNGIDYNGYVSILDFNSYIE